MTRIQELNAKIKQVRAEARAQIAQLQAELALTVSTPNDCSSCGAMRAA